VQPYQFLIDGEAICTNGDGVAVFDLIRRQRHGEHAVMVAFDLIALDGADLRRMPIEHRKRKLAKLVRGPHPGIVLNEHYEGDGEVVFQHACALGCEGIVSKRLGSLYRSGRSPHWVKVQEPKGTSCGARGGGGLGQQATKPLATWPKPNAGSMTTSTLSRPLPTWSIARRS
jgi:bifunctional non-homologous end joining protein LigD